MVAHQDLSLPRILARFRELTTSLGDPDVAQNSARMSEVLKERGQLERRAVAYEEWLKLRDAIGEAEGMVEDPEYREIAEEELPRLFERFARRDRSRSRETGGYGLGLSIVRAIARAHRGSAEARAPPGGGLALEVVLPA